VHRRDEKKGIETFEVNVSLPVTMPVSQMTPALVLRTRPFGESDKIVSFLTQDLGKITGIAKGARRSRRRFMNSLEPFSLIHLHLQDHPNRSLAFIVAAELLVSFKQLVTNLAKISYASYMVEITEGLIAEREENHLVFKHLRDSLSYLNENEPSLSFLTSFELILLRLTGYQPFLDSCKRCGGDRRRTAARWHFSFIDGGILCNCCARTINPTFLIGAPAVAVLKNLQAGHSPVTSAISLPPSVITEIRSLLLQFIQFHLDREIRSAPFLSQFA
jgi:DNA repair protein RecO (recombination protein O)